MELRLPDGRRARIQVPEGRHILECARDAGVELPSLCEQGWCCTCAVRVLSGRVDQSASRRFYEADRAAGFALICTGSPRSELVLLTHQLEAMRAFRIGANLPVPRGPTLAQP